MVQVFKLTDQGAMEVSALQDKLGLEKSCDVMSHALGVLTSIVSYIENKEPIIVQRKTGPILIVFPNLEKLIEGRKNRVDTQK